jgi:hypothetical protein
MALDIQDSKSKMSLQALAIPELEQTYCEKPEYHPESVSNSVTPLDNEISKEEIEHDEDRDSSDNDTDQDDDSVGEKNGSRWANVPYATASWTFKKLARLVEASKGQASKPVMYFLKK